MIGGARTVPVEPTGSQGPSPAALLVSAQASLQASDLEAAQAQIEQANALAEAVGDRLMHARAVTALARILYVRNELAEGMVVALRAIDLSEDVGDLASLAKAHETATRILLGVGESDAALEHGLASLRAADASLDLEATMAAMRALTNVYADLRQWDRALEFGERFCETTRLLGDKAGESAAIDTVSYVYDGMAREAADSGDQVLAQACVERTVSLSRTAMLMARAAGSRFGEATCLANLAEALADVGRPTEALELLDSWPADPFLDSRTMSHHHRETRGIVLATLGRHAEAVELLTKCATEAPSRAQEITACRALAALLEEIGDLRGALDHQKRMFVLISEQSSEKARRAASVAAVRLETLQAQTRAAVLQAEATALQLSNEQLNRRSEDLQRQALEDPLTGLPNRRQLDQLLATDLRSYSIVMVDVDHFKRVNDSYSHLVGDAVLRDLAKLLRSICRDGDTALRYGGEEFALLMLGTSAEGVLAAAERARVGVQLYDWGVLCLGLTVTASFGVALGSEVATSTELLALADRRLLRAKENGRNQVVGPDVALNSGLTRSAEPRKTERTPENAHPGGPSM
jgi:diguanylate cyclase (GGDEF)-like protein